jgi:hypothetical protein
MNRESKAVVSTDFSKKTETISNCIKLGHLMKVALFEFNYKNANLTGVLVVLDRKINLYLEST